MTDQLQQSIESLYNRAIGIPAKPCTQVFEAATVQEFEQAAAMLLRVQSKLRQHGNETKFGGVEGKVMTITHDGYTLRVTLVKQVKASNVTETSKEAYHTINFTGQRDRIAEIIRQHHQGITRKEIEVFHGFGSNAVTGRVKELLEMSAEKPFFLSGGLYRLEVTGTRLSLCKGASHVPNEVLQWIPDFGLNPDYYQSALLELEKQTPKQTELF